MTKYNGMTHQQLIEVAKTAYNAFLATFDKETELVSIDEVSSSHIALNEVCKELLGLISDECAFWWQYRNNNTAWIEWQKTKASVNNIQFDAWELVETKDWSVYK